MTAALLGAVLAPLTPPSTARAAEYRLETRADYDVQPDRHRVNVTVHVTFKNTTPDPPGQFSVFEVVDLAVQSPAENVRASDGKGPLEVTVSTRDGTRVASVRPRQEVRFRDEVAFTLRYVLPDRGAAQMRVGPSTVIFAAWGFGTDSRVTVSLPSTFEVAVDGNDLTATRDGDRWVLTSGRITDPGRWLALVTATSPNSYAVMSSAVALSSGTADLQVRAWKDDRAWGRATLALVAKALPLLEEEIGLDYPQVGPLVVTESVEATGALGEADTGGAEIAAAFDEPPFTLVHQAAHVWFRPELASDRWIREGFASSAAARLAQSLGLERPYDPATRVDELSDAAFPLLSWGHGEASAAQDEYAYAASWQAAALLTQRAGAAAMREAWQRIAGGVGSYEPAGTRPVAGAALTPAGTRELMDQLQAVSGADVTPIFRELVLDDETTALLDDRASARDAFTALVTAAGSWGAPAPIKSAMAGWNFDDAQAEIGEAMDWLADRDVLVTQAERAGLALPQRLRDQYQTAGGGPDARAELDAEAAVVRAYAQVYERLSAERSIFERLGLLGGPDPAELLVSASGRFSEGELRGAADLVDSARARLDAAAMDGVVRILSAVVLVLVVVAVAAWLVRNRRRSGSDYTSAP